MARLPDDQLDRLKAEIAVERLAMSMGVALRRHGADLLGFCRGAVKIIACIDDPDVVTRILDHLKSKRRHQTTREPRAPPSGLFPGNVTKLH